MTDLDIQAKDTRETEDMYRDMAARISISGTSRENLYTIAYVHPNPELGKRIVQAFLTIFTESSLGGTRADLTSSQKFLEDQIKNYETKLNEKNEQLEEFKRRNYGALPAVGGGDFYAEVSQTDTAINQAKLEMEEAANRMKQLQQQLADQDELLEMPSSQPTAATSIIDNRITALQTQVDNLRLRYTDLHPDIVRTKQLIGMLQEQKKQEEAQKAKEATPASTKAQNPLYQQLSIAIAEADANVASLKARVAQLESKRRNLTQSIDRIPQLQKEYADLMRDYDIYKSNYSQFLARKETAVLSGEVETKTDVVEFRVIDPPRASNQPVKPNRPLLMSLVPAGGLAGGVGLAFVLAQLRPTVDGRRQLQKLTGLQLLGTVTRVVTDAAQRRARRNHWVFAGAGAALLLAYASLMTYYTLISPAA
jgi:polysaccharide chain length determinant protein (PEP-CTERM system associated)